MPEIIDTSKMEEVKKEVAEIKEVTKTAEFNQAAVEEAVKRIVGEQVAALKQPVMNHTMQTPEDKAFVPDGKYHGMKKTEVCFANMLIDSINSVANPQNRIKKSADLEKAITSTASGAVDQWVPTDMQAQLWEDWTKRSIVSDKFQTIDMPTNPFLVPTLTGDTTIYRPTAEAEAPTASDPTSAQSTLSACKLAGKNLMSYEAEEDAIFSVLGIVRDNFAKQLAAAVDSVILNGDTTTGTVNINLSGGTIPTTSKFLCFDGLRHAALVDNTDMDADLGSLAIADIATLQALMGKYATRPSDVVMFVDPYTYFKMTGLSEVLTIDKYGNDATVVKGELAKLKGYPIVVSEELAKTNATGWVDNTAGSNTVGQIVLCHIPSWLAGWKRRVMVETDRNIDVQQYEIVASLRYAFVPNGAIASQEHTAVGFNITV